MEETSRKRSEKRGTMRLLGVAILVLVLLLVGLIAYSIFNTVAGTDDAEAPVGEEGIAGELEGETYVATMGETVVHDGFAMTVLGVRPAQLPEGAGAPESGFVRVAVEASVENRRAEAVPLNGVPYGVSYTQIRSAGVVYPGMLVTELRGAFPDGTVPAGSTNTLRFVYEIPEEAGQAIFEWPGADLGADEIAPTIVVELPAEDLP